MESLNNTQNLRIIDRQILELSLEDRAQRLDQFLAQQIKIYIGMSSDGQIQVANKEKLAEGFGEMLVKITAGMLKEEREHKIETNWNNPEEEREICRVTAEMAREYYSAPQSGRAATLARYIAIFTNLPMPLEELALEAAAVHAEGWENDMPLEERRIWLKLSKSSRPH